MNQPVLNIGTRFGLQKASVSFKDWHNRQVTRAVFILFFLFGHGYLLSSPTKESAQQFDPLMLTDFQIYLLVFFVLIILLVLWGLSNQSRLKKITRQKNELENQMLNLKSKQSEPAQNKNLQTEFLAQMSHEIRTPMNTVLGFTDILIAQVTDEQQKKYLSAIRSATKSLLTLINDILDLSKIESGKLNIVYEPVNPRMIFTEMENIFSEQVREKDLAFKSEIDPQLPDVLLLDEIRIRQILFNLISNAIKYTDEGLVKLVVNLENIKLSDTAQGMDILVEVRDTGSGIAPEDQKNIFKAFHRSESGKSQKIMGTGLGLHISKMLAGLMNGDIFLQSEPGKGSTFTLFLKDVKPIKTEIKKPEIQELSLRNVRFDSATVMIVDDIGHNRFLIKEFLKNSELNTFEASNGEEAIEKAEKYRPDLILMDIRMPVVDGMEATRIIRKNSSLKNVKIIALTASVMEEEIRKISNAGFDEFLKKPVKLPDLIRTLIRFIPHEIIESESSTGKTEHTDNNKMLSKKAATQLANELEDTLNDTWKKVNKSGLVDEINKFGKEVLKVANKYESYRVATYAKELIESSDSFDAGNMKKILKRFPELIKQLREN